MLIGLQSTLESQRSGLLTPVEEWVRIGEPVHESEGKQAGSTSFLFPCPFKRATTRRYGLDRPAAGVLVNSRCSDADIQGHPSLYLLGKPNTSKYKIRRPSELGASGCKGTASGCLKVIQSLEILAWSVHKEAV